MPFLHNGSFSSLRLLNLSAAPDNPPAGSGQIYVRAGDLRLLDSAGSEITFSAADHTHDAADIVSGVLANARVNWGAPEAIGAVTPSAGAFTQIKGGDGTASAPAFTFAADNDTGLYRSGDNSVWVSSGGSPTMRVQNSDAGNFLRVNDAATNSVSHALLLQHNTSGTPTTNFGTGLVLQGETTTTDNQNMARLIGRWQDATHATRQGELVLQVYDSAGVRDALRARADGSAVRIGFLGAVPVARPTVTGSRSSGAALESLLAALVSLGLITDSTTA